MNRQIEQTLTSLEVAEMIGKQHKNLLADIRGYVDELGELKIQPTDFFRISTYRTEQNKELPCYNITKKGCEFVSHKLTGSKGTEFTAKYINRFHAMEETIANHIPQGKELLALAVLEAQRTIEDQNQQITEMKPKALFADAVAASHTSILVGELAKIIKQNGGNMGQNRLFRWLRSNGYLIKRDGVDYNMPTQRSMELGLFEITERTFANPDGSIKITKTPKVTGKGQQYFVNKLLEGKHE